MQRGDSAKGSGTSYNQYKTYMHEQPFFHYIMLVLLLATLIISAYSLVSIIRIKNAAIPETVNLNDFLKKLTSHDEMKSYIGIAPLNVVQIDNNNLANMQSQIAGLDTSYLGNFLIQYNDGIVVYDYASDKIRGTVAFQQPQQGQLPPDFFTKLNKHPQMQDLQNEQPIGGQLDANSLSTLKQQFPDVYANAKTGDFLLRYRARLIIYDYQQDKIVNTVNLG